MDYIINTPCGQIKGVKSKYEGVVAYKGIRYATANRFELPKLVTYWDGIYDATKYGNCSYQPRSFYNEEFIEGYKVCKMGDYFNNRLFCIFKELLIYNMSGNVINWLSMSWMWDDKGDVLCFEI